MKKIIVNTLLLATFSIAMLVPDWKIQLAAQAGGCSPHEWITNPESCYGGSQLNGAYKGSSISERISR